MIAQLERTPHSNSNIPNSNPTPDNSTHHTHLQEELSPERARHLERNRLAAKKCRQRRRRAQSDLQQTLDDETARNSALIAEVEALKQEILALKDQLLDHARCDHNPVAGRGDQMVGNSEDPLGLLECPSPSFSTSTQSDESIMDPGRAAKTSMNDKMTREFYGDGLFDSYVDVPNM